ncbi:hypothetical protein [Altericista sp. CCNU0014]
MARSISQLFVCEYCGQFFFTDRLNPFIFNTFALLASSAAWGEPNC